MKKRKLMPNEKEDNDNIQPIKYDPENFRGSGNSFPCLRLSVASTFN
uniref:Uncharacterized protein n=1 Tax=Brassica oleracea TaxID=3712 RepID=A0A3P6CUP4_BRAOL|nr:unnamed protein product [Brassica oleracea]